MNGQRTFGLVAAVVAASALLATSAVAGGSSSLPADHYVGISAMAYTPQAVTAMEERYEAIADQYLAGSATQNSPQAVTAMEQRYEAMADYYGERWEAATRAQLEQARRQASAFSWADAGIGALAAIGAVALLGLGALGIRSHGERSVSPAAS